MKKLVYFILFISLLYSCSNTNKIDSSKIQNSNNDSISILNTKKIGKILKLFKDYNSFPYLVDTLYFDSISIYNFEPLAGEDVKILSTNLVEIGANYQYSISNFLMIDSLKTNNLYDKYLETIDIAMIKESDASALHKINFSDSIYALIWLLDYSTYEACPYAAGKVIFMTVIKNNQPFVCYNIGEQSGGGDAPYWSNSSLYSQIQKNTEVNLLYIDELGGEYDENDNEIVEHTETKFKINNLYTKQDKFEIK